MSAPLLEGRSVSSFSAQEVHCHLSMAHGLLLPKQKLSINNFINAKMVKVAIVNNNSQVSANSTTVQLNFLNLPLLNEQAYYKIMNQFVVCSLVFIVFHSITKSNKCSIEVFKYPYILKRH